MTDDIDMDWTGICFRCQKASFSHIMSMFNTDLICGACHDKERQHPQYTEALIAEFAAVKAGDLNYAGIGRPSDL